jgi:hypothetical protein
MLRLSPTHSQGTTRRLSVRMGRLACGRPEGHDPYHQIL